MDEPLPVPTIEKDAHREASFPARTLFTAWNSTRSNSAFKLYVAAPVVFLPLNLHYYLYKLDNYTFVQTAQLVH